jgi:glutamyl-tRNA synthetase
MSSIRVRFAPSPTGHLHIGGLRAALFNWLYARHNGGSFVIRIEDTDLERSKQEYTDSILASFAWCGISSDEPIVIQSERIAEHTKVIQELLKNKRAYYCYCTQAEVTTRHGVEPEDPYTAVKYDGRCRNRTPSPDDAGKPYAIRFALPQDRSTISFNDLIRGTVTFDMDQFDDFIIARSDGSPMYNFVVVVDDHHMKISHVIRGEDHISNTPKQIFLYEACGFPVPQFAHLPLILGPEGNRLSKRDAATSVLEYRLNGYLPDALLNYLVRLGWSHGDQEVFTREELVSFFTLEAVGKKGSIFDQAKLDWINSVYIRARTPDSLVSYIHEHMDPAFASTCKKWDQATLSAAVALYQDRVATVRELMQEVRLLHDGPFEYTDEDFAAWASSADQKKIIETLRVACQGMTSWTKDALSHEVKALAKQYDVKLVALAQPIRLALIGKTAGPGVFDMAALVGQQETVQRLERLCSYKS